MTIDSCSNDNEISCNVDEINEINESVILEPEIPPQPIDRHDTIDHRQESADFPPPSVPETAVEHVQEVSFPCAH